jgi:hypothetical protein
VTFDHSTTALVRVASIDRSKDVATTTTVATPPPPAGASSSDAIEKLADPGLTRSGTAEDIGNSASNSALPSASSSSIELGMPPRPMTADGTKHEHDQDRVVSVPRLHELSKEKRRRRRKEREENKVSLKDFEMMRVLGKGCAGKVSKRPDGRSERECVCVTHTPTSV